MSARYPQEAVLALENGWRSGLHANEIARQVSEILGRPVSPNRIKERAYDLQLERPLGFSGVKVKQRPATWEPQPATFDEVQAWADEHGVSFRSWDDLPAVNAKAFSIKEREFCRKYWDGVRRVG